MRPTATNRVAWSVGRSVCHTSEPCKMAAPTEMPFGLWTPAGPRNHVLDTVHVGAIWPIRLNRPCAAGDAALCQITYLRLSLGRWYTSAARASVYSVPTRRTWTERVPGRDVILRLNGTLNANCGNQSARSTAASE